MQTGKREKVSKVGGKLAGYGASDSAEGGEAGCSGRLLPVDGPYCPGEVFGEVVRIVQMMGIVKLRHEIGIPVLPVSREIEVLEPALRNGGEHSFLDGGSVSLS